MKFTKNLYLSILIIGVVIFASYFLFMNKNDSKTMDKSENIIISEEINKVDSQISVSEKKLSYMDVNAVDAKKLIMDNPDMIIIDVSPKYALGHIPGAINYYIGDGSLAKAVPELNKTKKYLVYCHVDSASIPGAQMLVDAGIEKVYRLEGNYAAWVDAGFDIEK